ncbi:XRE family transcriptional regulator [Azospirillum picis]|uniref:DNA-binding transcriptional regulator YdaS (Cro superfamily) n=1 Tax=Azospirillum picis TaxID=488438 RepID=A0ABU0MIF7_9PROT|nr:XRE family transcriptional regulator [Azospirillum picis]MBP2299629.1 DNA-binding transcriptional regulator YdaS (Cro superfamily) [Azospirillum picis]MDQ0533244.1 DNA-binding transcriptional regulator YdaS (Cro superfamily) [Azospirillum picis]
MTLDDWLTRTATKEEAFAALIGTSQAAVNRYRRGRRVPRPLVMARIVAATAGAVTANDFHGLADRGGGR